MEKELKFQKAEGLCALRTVKRSLHVSATVFRGCMESCRRTGGRWMRNGRSCRCWYRMFPLCENTGKQSENGDGYAAFKAGHRRRTAGVPARYPESDGQAGVSFSGSCENFPIGNRGIRLEKKDAPADRHAGNSLQRYCICCGEYTPAGGAIRISVEQWEMYVKLRNCPEIT